MFPVLPILSQQLSPPHMFGFPYSHSLWLVGLHTLSAFVIGLAYVVISATLPWLIYRTPRAIPFTWRPQYCGALAAAEAVAVAWFARYPDRNLPYDHCGLQARGLRACAV